MRRLRAGLVTPFPGGLGAPPYRHYDRCARSSLDGAGRKCLAYASAARGLSRSLPGGVAEPRWSAARRAGSVIARVAPRKRDSWCAFRRSAPLGLGGKGLSRASGEDEGVPGADSNNTGGGALACSASS